MRDRGGMNSDARFHLYQIKKLDDLTNELREARLRHSSLEVKIDRLIEALAETKRKRTRSRK